MAIAKPGEDERWRCAGCGNLTRFDVTRPGAACSGGAAESASGRA